jgi:BirA family transcriptional regulator, biotin operon repressor / biotin---[acetyl-CoA-carboxylase] ligase
VGADAVDPFTRYLGELDRTRPEGRSHPENLVVLRRVTSTNQLARSIVADYESEAQDLHPLLIVALEQSGGRGRQGRSWASPAGKGVYATRVLSLRDPGLLQALPLLVGLGLCRALSRHLPVPCRLKWPNDLVVETPAGRRKIGGILIEALVRPGEGAAAIIGFGVNHSHGGEDLPDLQETATSLEQLGGQVPLAELTWDLVAGLERELTHLEDDLVSDDLADTVARYRELSVHRPGDALSCRVGEQVVEGTFLGFDEHGRLRLNCGGEEILVSSGEVIE